MDSRGRAHAPIWAATHGGHTRRMGRQFRLGRAATFGVLLALVAVVTGCVGRAGPAPASLTLAWSLSPASNIVTIRVVLPAGAGREQSLAQSRLAVSAGDGDWSATGGTIRVPVPAGSRTTLVVELTGQQRLTRTITVTVPALPSAKRQTTSVSQLYCFAHSAGRAIYITIDDGWTPSQQVLTLMHHNYLPITAFLIADAARENLGYWKAFVAAGGTIGDHTVSHPNLTGISLSQATAQWKQARTDLGRWLGQPPSLGRPPYGAFNRSTEVAAARAGLTALVGWSATVSGNRVETWNGEPLSPGAIVILHWVPGLGQQLTVLLKDIRALRLNPAPLTAASFSGIAPQQRSLEGD